MENRNVFTCGVKWGYYAPPFTKICLDNSIAILGSYNNGIGTFRNADKGDLIVLKHGFYIIAIGEFKYRQENNQYWQDVLKDIYKSDKEVENLADKYKFSLKDEIDVIEVERWVRLVDNPIYYSTQQAAIQIRNQKIVEECNKRFDANNTENSDYNKAIENFTKAIELDSNNSEAYINRGDAYYTYSKYNDAMNDYNKAVELDNNNSKAYIHRGSGYCAKKEYDLAISDYTKSIELNPISETYRLRGSAYSTHGKYDNAIEDLDKAIELDNKNSKAYMNRGNTYNTKKEYDLAISDYTKSIELNPISEAYNFRGFIYFLKEEYDLAINDYTESIKLDDNNSLAYIIRGNAYNAKKEYDFAISNADKAIELKDNNNLAYMLKAIVYDAKKEYNEAIDNYRMSFDLDIKNVINGEIGSFIFQYINVINEDKYSLKSMVDKLVASEYLWKDEIYKNNGIKKLFIYQYILLYFLTFKEKDNVSEVAYYTSTVVLEKLIKDKSSMRMSTLSKVNDPEEGKILLEMLSKYTKKSIKEEVIKEEDCAVQTSFSRCIDSLTMFRLYGKNEDKEGTGVSLVFGKEFFDTTFQYNEVPFSSTEESGSVSNDIQNNQNKQPLYYVLYYDEKTNEIVFNPHKSNYKNIIINLNKLDAYNGFQCAENLSFVNIDEDDHSKDNYYKVENNIGYVLKEIFDIIKMLDSDEEVQNGYKALQNIKYLIKNSAFVEEQELRILKILDYNNLEIDYNIKSLYKDYFEVENYKALKQIILGPKIKNVYSVAETWKAHIKKEDIRYEGITVSVSKAPFN